MKFTITPEEAQPVAVRVAGFFRRKKMHVRVEVAAWADAPYRTTLVASTSRRHILVEAQGALSYGKALKALAVWLAAQRHYAEFYLAVSEDSAAQVSVIHEMKQDGVGLLSVSGQGVVSESFRGRNPALVVTPDPTLRYGRCSDEVTSALKKFNEGERKDGLRDMCELVERETETLALMASNRRLLIDDVRKIKAMKWENLINVLASSDHYNAGQNPLIVSILQTDLQSFRGARNLIDHKVRGKRENVTREKQFAERMVQGPRLLSELLSLQRKIESRVRLGK